MVYILISVVIVLQLVMIANIAKMKKRQAEINYLQSKAIVDIFNRTDLILDECNLILWKTKIDMTELRDHLIEVEEYESVKLVDEAIKQSNKLIEKQQKFREQCKMD